MIKFVNEKTVQDIIETAPLGKNTKFLKASHSLWTRFQNYNKHLPAVFYVGDKPVSAIFATCSNKSKYINLYEIVTIQGQERQGYAKQIWSEFVAYWHQRGMERIKLSCTPDSIGFHKKNGLVFWSVDKQGSLRSDQPLMPSIEAQIALRQRALRDPSLVMPKAKVCEKLKTEDLECLRLSEKKLIQSYEAILSVGEYWFRKFFNA
jgi:hypothetical protein|tara:strand:+ start:3573 stop:4190 length:618 start_codon:yes stop_codon:yes gene_type:complete